MRVVEPSPGVIAFIRPDEGANAGLVQTSEGTVVIDTTSCAADMQALLEAVGVAPSDVALVINTHSHSDHTWGNQLFQCRIISHRLCKEAMAANLSGAWERTTIESAIAERGASDPQWAAEMRHKIAGLRITLPTETFEGGHVAVIGGVRIELVHLGAHSPGSSVVWLPQTKTLFAGDLIFEGRYPFIGDADVPALISVLRQLPEWGAQTIVPGHGRLCGDAQMAALADYLDETWTRTAEHVAQGHSADRAASDPAYPRYAESAAERLHEANIRVMYARLAQPVQRQA